MSGFNSNYAGLFSKVINAEFRNIELDSPKILANGIQSRNYVGSLAGYAKGSILNNISVNNITVEGYSSVGGVIGSFKDAISATDIAVTGTLNTYSNTGGIFSSAMGVSLGSLLVLENLSFNGTISTDDNAGGVASIMSFSSLTNCTISGEVSSYGFSNGGVASLVADSTVSQCQVQADVMAKQEVGSPFTTTSYFTGGFFGDMRSSQLTRSSFTGNIQSIDRYVGGVTGAISGSSVIQDVSVSGNINADDCCTGGIVGAAVSYIDYDLTSVEIDNVIVTATINSGASQWAAGILGSNWASAELVESAFNVTDTYWDADLASGLPASVNNIPMGGDGKLTFELQCPTSPGDVSCDPTIFADWDESIWYFGSSDEYPRLIGDIDGDSYRDDIDVDDDNNGLIEIFTLQQLDLMRYDLVGTSLNGDSTGCPATGCNGYELMNDLDFDTNSNGIVDAGDEFWNNGAGWIPVGWNTPYSIDNFSAIFEGNFHAIFNFYISGFDSDYAGLFSKVINAEFRNIELDSPKILANGIQSRNYVGSLAGYAKGSILNNISVNNITVEGYSSVGGVIGSFKDAISATDIAVTGTLNTYSNTGGIFSSAMGVSLGSLLVLENLSFNGTISTDDNAGGVASIMSFSSLTNCTISGEVSSYGFSNGGVASLVADSTVSQCQVQADVMAKQEVGSPFTTTSYFTGGFFGDMRSSQLTRSSFTGNIQSIDRYVGGVTGAISGSSVIQDVSVSGNINADDCCTGGIVGAAVSYIDYDLTSVEIDNVIVTATINSGASQWAAGILGSNWASAELVESAFNVTDTYWDADLASGLPASVNNIPMGGDGKLTFELQCPTAPGDVSCDPTIFADWDATVWDFGTSTDYPVLR
jgi:hypothetical protein